jgi:hypothetical protein
MEFTEIPTPICKNSQNIQREMYFEHNNIEGTYVFSDG